jgi:hypothetical protein
LTDLRDLMVTQGDSAKQVWVTEVGTSNPGPGISDPVTERDWLKAMVDGILSYPWCGPFFVYDFHNVVDDPTDSGGGNYGIVKFDFTPKSPKYEYAQSIAGAPADPLDRTPPSAPTGLMVVDGVASWLPATDDVGVSVYRIYDNATGARLTQTTNIGQTSVPMPDSELTAGTPYTIYATAVDAAGNESPPSGTADFTTPAPSGPQQTYAYDFSDSPPIPTVFVQVGLGFTVTSGVALPNEPTVDGDYYTPGPYWQDMASPDHSCEITQDAASAYSDRYAMAGVRGGPDGTRCVCAFISGDGQADAAQIITIDAGVVTTRQAADASPLLPGEKLRITPSGNLYTAERVVNGVATELVSWPDTTGVYAGAANQRAEIWWRHKRVNGVYYPPNGIATFKATDLGGSTPSGPGGGVGAGTDAWTYAVTKRSGLGVVVAAGLWETELK